MKYKFLKTKAIFEIVLIITVSIFISLSLNSKDVAAVNGCCVVGEQCSEGVSQSDCTGTWGSGLCSEGTNVALCVKSCCVVGDNAFLTSKKGCDSYDGIYNMEINSQDSCTALISGSEEGCCVDENNYKYSLRGQCNGEFYQKTVCNLVTGYSEANYKSHINYKCGTAGTSKAYDIYWYDSAGNIEEIVKPGDLDSDGNSVDIDGDCNPSDLTRLQSTCRIVSGKAKCVSLDCETTWDNPAVDGDGVFRKNGESWCEYQAAVGPGMDLPGTQHYVHSCQGGKEIVGECAPDRSEICVQSRIDYGDFKLSTANCVDNTFKECIQCADEECCKDTALNCVWGGGKCLPLVPPAGSESCASGQINALTYWVKKCGGSWRCYKGCESYSTQSLVDANAYCGAYGDCGAKWNLAQEYSNKGLSRACPAKPNLATGYNKHEGCLFSLPKENNPFDKFKNAGEGLFLGEIRQEDLGVDKAISSSTLGLALINNYFASAFSGSVHRRAGTEGLFAPQGMIVGGTGLISTLIVAAILDPEPLTKMFILAIVAIAIAANLIVSAFTNWKDFVEGLGKMFKCSDDRIKTEPVFYCNAWQPPKGGENCYKCHTKIKDGGLLPDNEFDESDGYPGYKCTEQLCKSLGSECETKDETTGTKCVKVSKKDIFSPIKEGVSVDYENTKIYFNCESPDSTVDCSKDAQSSISEINEGGLGKGFTINSLLIDLYEGATSKDANGNFKLPMNISIKTNEDALCKYDEGDPLKTYEQMSNEFGEENLRGDHTKIHTLTLKGNLLTAGEHNLYLRCEDWNENADEFSYAIKYNVAKQPDFSPPIIEGFNPESNSYIKFEETKKFVELRINEPVYSTADYETSTDDSNIPDQESNAAVKPGCKYSNTNKNYDEMENEMICSDLKCSAELNVISGENKFYFRCRDEAGNANDHSTEYILKVSESELKINDILCEHRLPDTSLSNDCTNVYARNFTLYANTNGGVDGKAKCSYGGFGSGEFLETNDITNKQLFGGDGSLSIGWWPGNYNLNIKCVDEAGNEAKKDVSINIKVDNDEPRIGKVYSDGNYIYVTTNEEAHCYYMTTREFRYETANSMSTTDNLKHSTALVGKTYFKIGCADRFNNYMTPVGVYL